MNINEMTIGEAKEIARMFGDAEKRTTLTDAAIGKYVIVRSRNEGLNSGVLVAADETGCVIESARRLWYSKPKDSSLAWYEGVAETGLHKDSRISGEVDRKYIVESYSITICSEVGEKSLRAAIGHES